MKKILFPMMIAAVLTACGSGDSGNRTGVVTFREDAAARKVDVWVDGKYFTSYIWPDDLEKQVLNPIHTASGVEITRGYPIAPRPYERVDHPHHVGLWLNFGNVNGLDFWNNSFAVNPENRHRYGSIRLREIEEMNEAEGTLTARADWVDHEENVLLTEKTTYRFGGDASTRVIERTTELTAVTEVTFTEDKEGLFGIRMDRAFEEPAERPVKMIGSDGVLADEPILHNDGVTGMYRNALGDTAGDVWSKRSPWVALRGVKEGEVITVAVFDHPVNPGYPAWSHARGYGLFATNNLGGRAFDPEAEELVVRLEPGESMVFRHLVVIGGELTDGQIEEIAAQFGESK